MIGTDQPKCWGEAGTVVYRANVTANISGNGNYVITNIAGLVNSTNEVDGITLFIIYKDNSVTYQGSLIIWDGAISETGSNPSSMTMTGFSACANAAYANAFVINSDFQKSCGWGHTVNMNGGSALFSNDFYNFDSTITNVTSGQNSAAYWMNGPGGECYGWSVMGLYYQTTSCITCGGSLAVNAVSQNVLCNGQCMGTATVTPTSGTAPYTYSWSNTETTQVITGLCAGNYSVTVTDSANHTATAAVVITQPPVLTASASAVSSACGGNTGAASVSASGGTPGYTYYWNPTGQTTQTATGLGAGNYTITITDVNGCTTAQTASITSGSLTATATGSTVCAGQTATLTASGGTNYSWSTGATTAAIAVAPAVTTTYSVIVSTGSCSDTATTAVIVNPSPVVSAGNNVTVCAGSAVALTASGGNTYSWNNGQTTSSITVNPAATTSYTVVATNGSGCTGIDFVTVVITPSITANAGPDGTICAGDNVQLSASGGTGYSWIPSTGLSNTSSNNPIASPGNTTTYTVIVTSGSCMSDSDEVTVVVNPNPTAAAWSNVTIIQGQSATIAASGGANYLWSNGANGNSITVTPTQTTLYCVTVTNAFGCIYSACVTVYIEPINCSPVSSEEAFALPTAFSPNNDGQNDRWRLLYAPLLADCIAEFHIAVYNRWGEKVFEGTDLIFNWDGTFNGKIEGTAVFGYYLNAVMKSGQKINKKGNVSLIR
jgi:gliding motility-associated-like protein